MKILVTGSGCPGWFSVYQSLNDYQPLSLVGCDLYAETSGALLSDKHFVVSRGDARNYTAEVLDIVREEEINCIIPLTDPELLPLSALRGGLSDCHVLVSSFVALTTMLSKYKLYSAVPEVSPGFSLLSKVSDVRDFVYDVSDGKSCYIKLSKGYGSRGTKKIVGDQEWLHGFASEKPEAFGSTFPVSQVKQLPIDPGEAILIETLPGEEYSIDCLFDSDNKLVFYGVREREATRNGICHTARFVVDEDKEFHSFITAISSKVPMQYNINIQARKDRDGQLKLLEINPRISGSAGSFVESGFNLPAMGLDLLLTGGIHHSPPLTPESYPSTRAYRVSHFIS